MRKALTNGLLLGQKSGSYLRKKLLAVLGNFRGSLGNSSYQATSCRRICGPAASST